MLSAIFMITRILCSMMNRVMPNSVLARLQAVDQTVDQRRIDAGGRFV